MKQPNTSLTLTTVQRYVLGKLLLAVVLFRSLALTGFSELPPNLQHIPVMVSIPVPGSSNSTYKGTGLYLRHNKKLFFVTAKHVLFKEVTLVTSTSFTSLLNTNIILASPSVGTNAGRILQLDSRQMLSNHTIKVHPYRDLAVALIGTVLTETSTNYSYTLVPGVTFLRRGVAPTLPEDIICRFDAVQEGQDAVILGYPTELLAGGTQEVDFDNALMRKGIISQKNSKTGKYIVDTGVFGGNSGGPLLVLNHPAINVIESKVIGIMVQFVPASTRIFPNSGITNSVLVYSGYSVAEPIDGAVELFRQFE